jgi:hypothetical protein
MLDFLVELEQKIRRSFFIEKDHDVNGGCGCSFGDTTHGITDEHPFEAYRYPDKYKEIGDDKQEEQTQDHGALVEEYVQNQVVLRCKKCGEKVRMNTSREKVDEHWKGKTE